MDWSSIETMDPHLLLGIVNTALRNHHDSLEDLCLSNEIDQTLLITRLAAAGYDYMPAANQFR